MKRQIAHRTGFIVVILSLALAHSSALAGEFWGTWPEKSDPKEVGKRLAVNLLNRPTIEARPYGVIYPEVCNGYGSVRFAGTIKDKALLDQLVMRYQGMLVTTAAVAPSSEAQPPATAPTEAQPAGRGRGARGGRGGGGGNAGLDPKTATAATMIPLATHVDRSVFGILPLEIYRQTNDARYLPIGKKSADDQWAKPDADGLTDQTRWWIDDMFMVTSIQTEAYRATKDKIYLDRGAKQMAAYLDKLQQPNGLFYHADDSHFYWGRGNGWVAAGLAELLMELPSDHPQYPRIMDGYKKMMAALLKYQAPSGMWRQLIDNDQSWEETSGTGMFTFGMATGVKKGWLDAKDYKEAARKAWIALSQHVDENANMTDTCVGTNKGFTVEYYMTRGKTTGDLHGQAGTIWAAWAVLD